MPEKTARGDTSLANHKETREEWAEDGEKWKYWFTLPLSGHKIFIAIEKEQKYISQIKLHFNHDEAKVLNYLANDLQMQELGQKTCKVLSTSGMPRETGMWAARTIDCIK